MKKKLLKLPAAIVLLLAVVIFVALVGNGIVATRSTGLGKLVMEWTGYTVIFGNKADSYIREAASANVAAFTLLVIGVVFQAVAFGLLFPNPKGSKKFPGFLFFVGGLMELAFGIIVMCSMSTTGLASNEILTAIYTLNLGAGIIIPGIAAMVAALASCIVGVLAWKNK